MLDPTTMYIDSFHPAQPDKRRDWKGPARYRARTQRPPRYYLIDFGLSKVYPPEDGPPRDIPVQGGDKSVPEFANDSREPYDPFPVDVYYLGNWIREYFMKVSGVCFGGVIWLNILLEIPRFRLHGRIDCGDDSARS
jgi:hypothetical protein